MTPWTVAHQAPLSVEFSRQEYSSGLELSNAGIELSLLHSGSPQSPYVEWSQVYPPWDFAQYPILTRPPSVPGDPTYCSVTGFPRNS